MVSDALPVVFEGRLHFSPEWETQTIVVGSDEWYRWLEQATQFIVKSEQGMFAFYKERVGNRRRMYWRAVHSVHGKKQRFYLGSSARLTRERLDEATSYFLELQAAASTGQAYRDVPGISFAITKFTPPQLRGALLERPHLLALLKRGGPGTCTLVGAPAGYGKTTLLVQWQQCVAGTVAWVALEQEDNDPTRFWSAIVQALEHAGIASSLLANLHALLLLQVSNTFVSALVNTIEKMQHDVTIILDDFHLIETPVLHDAIRFLIQHVPTYLHLVIAGRTDFSPMPLARLRVEQRVQEVRLKDMKCTEGEASKLLTDILGLQISAMQMKTLVECTEGWMAGLQMAALAIRENYALLHTLDRLASSIGDHQYILVYFLEEVLRYQAEETTHFLLCTCLLNRFTVDLCNAVTQNEDGEARLAELVRKNLFIVPLGDGWYRYHHLFAEILRKRVQRRMPERVVELHRRASRWYEQADFVADAIDHALMCQDFERMRTLLWRIMDETIFVRNESVVMQNWLSAVPVAYIYEDAYFCFMYICLYFHTHMLERMKIFLERGWQAIDTVHDIEERRMLEGKYMAMRGALALRWGDMEEVMIMGGRALSLIAEADHLWRGIVQQILAPVSFLQGDVQAAHTMLVDLRDRSDIANDVPMMLSALQNLSWLYTVQGCLRQAERTHQQYIQRAQLWWPGADFMTSAVYMHLSALYYEWNDLTTAARYAQQGLASARQQQLEDICVGSMYTLACIHQARNEQETMYVLLKEAEQIAQKSGSAILISAFASYKARLMIQENDLATGLQWYQAFKPFADTAALSPTLFLQYMFSYITMVKILLASGQIMEARAWLDRLIPVAKEAQLGKSMIELSQLRVIVLQRMGETDEAMQALLALLEETQTERYTRSFVAAGDELEPLLRSIVRKKGRLPQGLSLSYVDSVLAAFSPVGQRKKRYEDDFGQDRLTSREREVVQLLAKGCSDQAIADQLSVTRSTINTHLKHIYRKLGVNNRTQAVLRANSRR